jgi:hypothetical protein
MKAPLSALNNNVARNQQASKPVPQCEHFLLS